MVALRITFDGKQFGQKLQRSMRRNADAVRTAIRATAQEAADRIETEGRNDISAAGNFGARWTEGFITTVGEGGGHIRIRTTMAVPYWTVFQTGKVIQGKPLLWIPLSFASDAQGVRARDYPGQLFRVDRKAGAPLLMSGNPAEPKYFGAQSVTLPKKFHIFEIIQRVARDMSRIYRANFKKALGNGR